MCNKSPSQGGCTSDFACANCKSKLIRMDRKYKTRNGKDVRILCVDADHPTHPVVGLVAGRSLQWPASGISINQSQSYDLIEVKEKVKVHFVCWYRKDDPSCTGGLVYRSEADARGQLAGCKNSTTYHYWYECIEKEVE